METWILLALLAPLFYALSNVVDKFLLSNRVRYCFAMAPIAGFAALLFGLGALFFVSFKGVTTTQMLIVFFLGLVITIVYVVYYYVMSVEEASRVVSIAFLSPIFVLLFAALFLGERLSGWKYFAVLLVIGGAVLIGIQGIHRGILMRKGFYWRLLTCLLNAGIITTQKYMLGDLQFLQLFTLQCFGLFTGLSLTLLSPKIRAHFKHVAKSVHYIFLSEGLTFIGALIFLFAVSNGPVSIVSALSSVQPVYMLILALLFSIFLPSILKEEFTRKTLTIKIVAVLMIAIGAYLVAV